MKPPKRNFGIYLGLAVSVIAGTWIYLRHFESLPSASTTSTIVASENLQTSTPLTETSPEKSRQSAPLQRVSPSEEVQSWGKPLYEGEVALPESRRAHHAIYRTKMKYPLMLVQQLWRVSESDPLQKEYVGERKMIADHLLVRLRDDTDSSVFEGRIQAEGMSLRKKMYTQGLYLVSFPIEGVDTLQKMQSVLLQMPEVSSANPDIFSRGF